AASLLVLLGVSTVVAAPAPLPKTPRSSVRVWQLDLSPLAAAPKKSSLILHLAVNAEPSNGTHTEGVSFTIAEGRITKVRITDGLLISVLGQPAAEGIRQALAHDLREALGLEAVALGQVIEFHTLWRMPVSEVTVTTEGRDKKFAPVAKFVIRRK